MNIYEEDEITNDKFMDEYSALMMPIYLRNYA
jgi:hypothetical protein